MSIWCQICNELKSCDQATQLVPCLHTFCNFCLTEATKLCKVCPAMHCYSSISTPEVIISTCEGEQCQKKLVTAPEILRTACHHDICQHCFDMACRKDRLTCPAPGCGEPMIDDDDLVCDGPCKVAMNYDQLMIIPCCGAKMCLSCLHTWTNGNDFCHPGKCITKDKTKKKKSAELIKTPCLCKLECEGEVLRNFPTEFECDHDVCLSCLARMLNECEKNDKSPYCPNKTCGIPYRCESVIALRAQFPERMDFFSKFSLSVKYSMQTLKDDSVTEIQINELWENYANNQQFSLRVNHCEDEDVGMVLDFLKDGCLGDLIREVRRILKVLTTDKIYGYYRMDEPGHQVPLVVDQNTIQKTCTELNISEKTTILVDTSGIVSKSKK